MSTDSFTMRLPSRLDPTKARHYQKPGQVVVTLLIWATLGFQISDDIVGRLVKQEGYGLQRTRKTEEGAQHPDGTPSSAMSTIRF
jgi:hypothetical protein